jgi:hypothetical protein
MASFFTPIQPIQPPIRNQITPSRRKRGEREEERSFVTNKPLPEPIQRSLFTETPPPEPVKRRFGIKPLQLQPVISMGQEEYSPYSIPNEDEEYESSVLTKNMLQNQSKKIENHSVDDLYEEFVSVLTDPEFSSEEITKGAPSSSSANIKVGAFGSIVVVEKAGVPKFVIKKIKKRNAIKLNREDVDVEIENIQYINQHMSDTYVIKHVILKDHGTYYFISKYLQGYITLYDYLLNFAKSNNYGKSNNSKKRSRIIAILQNIKSAMDEMYNAGIIHNDAHLQNIKINPDTLEIKILDYGICSILGRRERPDISPEMTNQERVKRGVEEGVRRRDVNPIESGAKRYYITITQSQFDTMYQNAMAKVLGTTLLLMTQKNLHGKNLLSNVSIQSLVQTFLGTEINAESFYNEYVQIPDTVQSHFRIEDGVVERKIRNKVEKIRNKVEKIRAKL